MPTFLLDFTVTAHLRVCVEAQDEIDAQEITRTSWVLLDHDTENTDVEFHSVSEVAPIKLLPESSDGVPPTISGDLRTDLTLISK